MASAIGGRDELENVAIGLLRMLFQMQKSVRLLGISTSGFSVDDFQRPEQIVMAI